MTNFLKKNKYPLLILLGITILYFLLRLPNLTLQPVFADEAIYLRWAQVMKAEPTLRFVSLQDGKTPLFMWLMIPLFKIIKDPLLAGRLLSVLTGYASLIGVLFLGWKFLNKRVGLWAAFLIAITPFMVFFDRMALVDSMLATFSLWSLILAIWLVKNNRLDLSLLLGYMLGGSMLTKTPGMFNILMIPVTLIGFNFKDKDRTIKFIKLAGFWIIAIVTAMVIYNVLRLGQGFDNLSSRNQDYIHPLSRLWTYPIDPLKPHFLESVEDFIKFLGLPTLAFIVAGAALAFTKKSRVALTILAWSLIPYVVELELLKAFTARYILFCVVPLIVIAGFAIDQLIERFKNNRSTALILILSLLLVWPIFFDLNLLINPANAPLPKNERTGYLEDWTAGVGLRQIATFLTDESKKQLIVVGTEGSFGTLPEGLQIYFDKNRNVIIIGGRATVSAQLRSTSFEHPTYFVANRSRFCCEYPAYLKLLRSYPKAKNSSIKPDAMLLFEVLPVKDDTTATPQP